MGAPKFPNGLDRAAIHQAAGSRAIRYDHDSLGVQRLRGFGHEPHSREGDHVTLEIAGLAGKFEAVAYHVRQRLNRGLLIVVREQNRAPLAMCGGTPAARA